MTQITDLQVHDPGYVTCQIVGEGPFEVKLDGWQRYRPVEEFSWYDPWLVLGSVDKPLSPGLRNMFARGSQPGEAAATFRVGYPEPAPPPPEPPPPPERKWVTIRDLSSVRLWDGILNAAPGSRIYDVGDAIRIDQPNKGERCEMQCYDKRLGDGVLARYTFDVNIDPRTVIDPSGSGTDTITQQHGNNQSGYGGGLTVRASDRMVILRVKGGERLSASGSQRYEYESDGKGGSPAEPKANVEVGKLRFGEWHTITVEAKWSKVWDGYVRARLDDGPWVGVSDVPTFCGPADVQMYRIGWYSSSGPVPKLMDVRNAQIEVPA